MCAFIADAHYEALPVALLDRASFITALRSSDAAPEVLQAAARSMKHLIDSEWRLPRSSFR